jgi:hypothetical protein
MTDPITAAARAAAEQLAAEYGPGLAVDVEVALHAQATDQKPGRYLDPVSLGTLIVTIATLAWSIYSDKRKRTPEPSPDVIARHVRVELRQLSDTRQQESDRITEIVVTEIIQAAKEQR